MDASTNALIETIGDAAQPRFPAEYFKELCRLRHVPYRPDMKLPQYFGHLTNNLVYSRLAPCVLEELQKLNTRDAKGRRSAKHFQWLSGDIGHPRLLMHLGSVVALMKVSQDWDFFIEQLDTVSPIYGETLRLEFPSLGSA